MHLDLSNTIDVKKAENYLSKLIEGNSKIELKRLSDKRTAKQNRALHKFFVLISDQLNEMGLEFTFSGLNVDRLCTRYTPSIVKDFFWRPIQMALFEIESTTKIDTKQINEIIDVISKFFGDRGVKMEFPSIDNLMKSE